MISSENLNRIITEVQNAYNEISNNTSFFSASCRRLEDLRFRIHSNQTRIAVIGITSSGKSTLLNAILGRPLLPTRVGPSSSKQVLCGYDETFHADIIFEEETRKERLVVKEHLSENLQKYGDEKFNPQNKEGVSEIHVFSPEFRFSRELVFVDTPGLDAYGLSIHEEITLKMILPTVDMVMFLTNVKCDSDAENLAFIDRATSEIKPLIAVQNKIDSIKEKRSLHGVEKTKDEVKREHYNRLARLLSRARKKSVREAPIIQISAREKSWDRTNLESLRAVLTEQMAINSKFRSNCYLSQLERELKDMAETLENVLLETEKKEEQYYSAQNQITQWQENIDVMKNKFKDTNDELLADSSEIYDACQSLSSSIDNKYSIKENPEIARTAEFSESSLDSPEISGNKQYKNPHKLLPSIKKAKDSFSHSINFTLEKFNDTISEIQRMLSISCANLNLQENQVIHREIFGYSPVSIPDCEKVVKGKHHPARRVEQRSLWGKVKRALDIFDCGYDYRPSRIDPDTFEYDIPALIESIKAGCQSFEMFFEQYSSFQENTEFSIKCLESELKKRKEELDAQYKTRFPIVDGEKVLTVLRSYLSEIKDGVTQKGTVKNAEVCPKQTMVPETFISGEYDSLILNSVSLAQNTCLDCHRKLMTNIILRSEMKTGYICGWDSERMTEFRDIFFKKKSEIDILDFSQNPKDFPSETALLFFLVNAEQSGSMENKIFNSRKVSQFLQASADKGKIVWVMDSVHSLVSVNDLREDTLMEAFMEMVAIAKHLLNKKDGDLFEVMVCDRELYYTVLLHEIYFNKGIGTTENGKQNFVNQMGIVFRLSNERRHATGQYVNQFMNYRKDPMPHAE